MSETLRSGEVTIRRPVIGDRPALIRANTESRAYHEPWVYAFLDETGFRAWFERSLTGASIAFLVLEDGAPAGVINLNNIVMNAFRSAQLGYYGFVGFEGRGVMAQGLARVIDVAFGDLGLHRLEAAIQPDNVRSIALVKRLGFQHEGFSPRYLQVGGVWRDHERFARLADEDGSKGST